MMLPKTACPDVVGVFSKIEQNRTAKPNTTSLFAIPPLLADPFPVSLCFVVQSFRSPAHHVDSHNSAKLPRTFDLVGVAKEGFA
jgi:hypothetical protein